MTDPRTEAGRALWNGEWDHLAAILDIERQARTATLERLRAVVEGLPQFMDLPNGIVETDDDGDWWVDRAAVLEAIAEEAKR